MPDKWEREIEDLLRDKFPDGEPRPLRQAYRQRPRQRRPQSQNDLWRRVQSLSPERLMLYGLGLALAAYLFRPFFGGVTMLMVVASVALIVAAIAVSILKRESPYVEKRWRGQVIHLPSRRGPFSSTWHRWQLRLRRWLGSR